MFALLSAVTVAVVMIIVIMAVIVVVVAFVVGIAVAMAVIVVILVLAVVISVIVADFIVELVAMPLVFPAAMASPIGMLAAHGEGPAISEVRIIVVVDVSVESNRSAEPGTRAIKYAPAEPFRAVVAEGCALVRRVVEVAVRADRRHADVDADLNGGTRRSSADQDESKNRRNK